ncbi:Protein kinase, catalytic domain-containing protein [Cynara cardunculus var. scolymus]|uniref:non-specific serine/threonine protein kinase n=1 Tax=Cynara cardunculus var. scolymus TaxID=59895 RepID=A0A103XKA1_CYNCS|nr:Protein kinase, catalytic domain-containing protein [Cynara cardunculus var. scolymus]
MKGPRRLSRSIMRSQKSPEIESDESSKNKRDQDNESDDQTSPRGVLEVVGSGSDSDNSSYISRSVSENSYDYASRSCLSFKAPAAAGCDGDGENNSNSNMNPVSPTSEIVQAEAVPWRNLIDNLKWKSFRRLSAAPLVAGYELSRKSFMKKLGRNHSSEATINEFYVPKPSWRNFSFEELTAATNSFSSGKYLFLPSVLTFTTPLMHVRVCLPSFTGGHAEVYKGCLPDGQIVAVKKITKKEKKDEDRVGDFLTELGIIAHINHPNAARLIGFSSDNDLYLVLQYAPHGSLATLLHNSEEIVEWNIRFKIAIGIAEGLEYLHYNCNKRIIHRDITASNILLTEDYEPQISDFGLAKWLPESWAQQIVSPIEGTFGYMAPEYFMHGVINEKTDVFAFGAKPLLEQGDGKGLVDPRLGNDYDLVELKRAMLIASSCIHHMPDMRPNIKRVLQILKGESPAVELRQKTFDGRSLIADTCDLEDYTCKTYLKELNRHRELVME